MKNEIVISPLRKSISLEMNAPASKSMSVRALCAGFLAGDALISDLSDCEDSKNTMNLLKSLGTEFSEYKYLKILKRSSVVIPNELSCGESALLLRLIAPILSSFNYPVKLTGTGSLLSRNQSNLIQVLRAMNVQVSSNSYLPLSISGMISPGKFFLDFNSGSQVLSGLLFSLPLLNNSSTLKISNLKSKGYIDLSIQILEKFGILIDREDDVFHIRGNQRYIPNAIKIEGDWSSAAFFLVAAAINGEININNLNPDSLQPDREIIDILIECGAELSCTENQCSVKKGNLKAFEYNAEDTPDLIPILTTLAINCDGVSKIYGINRLFNKESNRAEAIISEFKKLDASLYIEGDCLFIKKSKLKPGKVESFNDHRIAMALAIAALNSESEITIKNPECTAKSYPDFWRHLSLLYL